MEELFERILFLIEKFENNSQSQFARKIGCPQTTLNGYLNLAGQEKIKISLLKKILAGYPEVNRNWLYFGQQPMFKDSNFASPELALENLSALEKENERLKQELAEADRLNRKLTARLLVDGVTDEKSASDTARAAGQE